MPESKKRCQAGIVDYKSGLKSIVVAGGTGTKTSFILDLDSFKWRRGPDLPFHIESGTITQIGNTFMIVVSEDKFLLFVPETESWKDISIGKTTWPNFIDKEPASFSAFMIPNFLGQCSGINKD